MFKRLMTIVEVGVIVFGSLYCAMDWAYIEGQKTRDREWFNKIIEKAEKHPEMTLAQLCFEKIED